MAGKYLAPRKNTPGGRPKGGDSIRDKQRKIITISLAVLFFLLALGLTVYPIFSAPFCNFGIGCSVFCNRAKN